MDMILDEAGAHVVAAREEIERRGLRWRHSDAIKVAHSGKLRHHIEINEFFSLLSQATVVAVETAGTKGCEGPAGSGFFKPIAVTRRSGAAYVLRRRFGLKSLAIRTLKIRAVDLPAD